MRTFFVAAAVLATATAEPNIPVPDVDYPLPVADNIENNADGTLKYLLTDNPIIYIHRGFNDIWSLADSAWANGGATGSGPDEDVYDTVEIVDSEIWVANIAYCEKVTNSRTVEQAKAAYLDAMRGHNFAVLDGLGPMYADYLEGANAYTTLFIDDESVMDPNYGVVEDEGNDAGDTDSALGNVSSAVTMMREWSASTSGSKYFFSSPRPWRMNSYGEVVSLGHETHTCVYEDGTSEEDIFDKYVSNVSVVPALMCERRQSKTNDDGSYKASSIGKDGGYPSGHTNAAYLAAIGIAYSIPERFSEMWTRASQLGENRIVSGFHSPLDVIGGRIQATAITAAALNEPGDNAELKAAAVAQANAYFSTKLAAGQTLYEYAHTDDTSAYADHDANKALYLERMTYGFPKDLSQAGQAPIVPEGAEALLESRLPYLTDNQRRAVLYTTSIDSGYSFLDKTNGWGRLNLVAAADGYGEFLGDVDVSMDSKKGGFHAQDSWRNDIKGLGGLIKGGCGQLTLAGKNSYSGGTQVKTGTLVAASTTALGMGEVSVKRAGTLVVDAEGTVAVRKSMSIKGALHLVMDSDSPQLSVGGFLKISGHAELVLDFSNVSNLKGSITLISAGFVSGKFKHVSTVGSGSVTVMYTSNSVVAYFRGW